MKRCVFAGMTVDCSFGFLETRIANPNLDLETGTKWSLVKHRFRSGHEFSTGALSRGQMMGHIARVLDNSNLFSIRWAPFDLLFLFKELRQAGWSRQAFIRSLRRIALSSPNTLSVVELTELLISHE